MNKFFFLFGTFLISLHASDLEEDPFAAFPLEAPARTAAAESESDEEVEPIAHRLRSKNNSIPGPFKEAQKGDAESQFYVGMYYDNGICCNKNKKKAFEWHMKAALQKHVEATYQVAWCFEHASGVNKDLSLALYWFKEASKLGHSEATYNVGRYYEIGWGTPPDKEEGVKWLIQAAEEGNKNAKRHLERMGSPSPKEEKPSHLDSFFKILMQQGDKEEFRKSLEQAKAGDVASMFCTAACYDDGKGTAQNKKEAFK